MPAGRKNVWLATFYEAARNRSGADTARPYRLASKVVERGLIYTRR